MPSYHWLKLWIDILDDWKVAPLPDRLWRRFVECCLIAKKIDEGGHLEPLDKMAFILRLHPAELEADLIELGQLTKTKDQPGIVQCIEGRWLVTNLEKRQSRMTATERKRKQRERDRGRSQEGHAPVTESDHRGQRTEDRQTEDRGSDNRQQTETGADAPDAAAAVLALQTFGMSQPEKVITETKLPPPQIVDVVRYAKQEKLGAGWVRTQLRENQAHRPRAPADRRRYVEGEYAGIIES